MVQTQRERLPSRRRGIRATIGSGMNKFVLSTGDYPDGRLGELFIDAPKEGSFSRAILNALAISISIGLQHGIPLSTFQHAYAGFRMSPDILANMMSILAENYEIKSDVIS